MGLSAVGLGGVATALGIAPAPVVATFLGLTPVGWGIAGVSALAAALGLLLTRKTMRRMNEERAKGGLTPITIPQIIRELHQFEAQSMLAIRNCPV